MDIVYVVLNCIMIVILIYLIIFFNNSANNSAAEVRLLIRNNKVFEFREYLLGKYGLEVYDKMPSYDDMLNSHKPLEEPFWIPNYQGREHVHTFNVESMGV